MDGWTQEDHISGPPGGPKNFSCLAPLHTRLIITVGIAHHTVRHLPYTPTTKPAVGTLDTLLAQHYTANTTKPSQHYTANTPKPAYPAS